MNNPIRVLQVLTIMNRGGAETMVMNYYRNIDRSKVQFDFLLHRQERGAYDDEIEAMGGRIFRIPPIFNFFAHKIAVKRFFNEHPEYLIIHGHVGELGYCIYKEAAKRGVPTIIAHAHNNSCDKDWKWPIRTILKHLMRPYINTLMTCGIEAAIWLFGKKMAQKAIMLKNAIDAQKYMFNEKVRKQVRNEMGWDEHWVIGNVARFAPQKNHFGLLSIFKEVLSTVPSALLVLVGEKAGLYNEVKCKAESLGIAHAVQYLGVRNDVPQLMMGMDIFCFPSNYEGFGIVLLEAQAAGLYTLKSTNVPNDAVVISDLVSSLDLSASTSEWADLLTQDHIKINTYDTICGAGFDIHTNAAWLQDFYLTQHHSK